MWRFSRVRKREFIFKCLEKYGLLREGGILVDLGCGSGAYVPDLVNEGLFVIGIDLSLNMLRVARRSAPGAQFVLASMYDLPLRSAVFDALIAMGPAIQFHSASHFGIHKPALLEIRRTAKRGAAVVFDLNNPLTPLYFCSYPRDIFRLRRLAYPWSVVRFMTTLGFKVAEVASCVFLLLPVYHRFQLKMERHVAQIPILRFFGRFLMLCAIIRH